jgi:hypothetical protein
MVTIIVTKHFVPSQWPMYVGAHSSLVRGVCVRDEGLGDCVVTTRGDDEVAATAHIRTQDGGQLPVAV